MENGFQPQSWLSLVKNPLSVIALFISLIYGMCSLLLGQAVVHINESNQTILVWFIALYPVLTLAVFTWLVVSHHRKIYGPTDFRSDDTFIKYLSPESVANKLQEEAEQAVGGSQAGNTYDEAEPSGDVGRQPPSADEPPEAPQQAPVGPDQPTETARSAGETSTPHQPSSPRFSMPQGPDFTAYAPGTSATPSQRIIRRVKDIFVAENLVMQELQAEFGAPVARNISIKTRSGRLGVDGLILRSGSAIVVEVALLDRHMQVPRIDKLDTMISRILDTEEEIKVVAAVVSKTGALNHKGMQKLDAIKARYGEKLTIRIYQYEFLTSKYGIQDGTDGE